jgi:hypothetical protein
MRKLNDSSISRSQTNTSNSPRFITGHAINIGMLCLSLIITSWLLVYCSWENKKRATGKRDNRLREGDESMLGYRHPSFRYTL